MILEEVRVVWDATSAKMNGIEVESMKYYLKTRHARQQQCRERHCCYRALRKGGMAVTGVFLWFMMLDGRVGR